MRTLMVRLLEEMADLAAEGGNKLLCAVLLCFAFIVREQMEEEAYPVLSELVRQENERKAASRP